MQYFILFVLAFFVAIACTPLIKKFAFRLRIVDEPNSPRKIHTKPIPLLGGFIIYLSFILSLFIYLAVFHPNYNIVPLKFYLGIVLGGLVLMIGGFLDDKYNLSPKYQFISTVIAVLILILSGVGVGITIISNPFHSAHPISLNFKFLGIQFSAIFVFLFMLGMIYTTKFLDGMDGLASGISFIAGLTLFFLSLTPKVNQSITASLTMIFCGAVLGFLIFNFNPASIFLGESGSTFVGFMLGAFSILLGGKIATAVLVMGIPIMDVAWVIVRRVWYGDSPFKADRKHLHYRLLDIGFSQKETVFILYFIAGSFGFVAIFLQSLGKLISLLILIVIMVVLALVTVAVYKRKYALQAGLEPNISENHKNISASDANGGELTKMD